MADFQLKTPVAFILFNRPDTTERVFAEIARARPPKLLVIADGPRADRPGEAELCAAARALIKRVDWPCEVLTNYSAENLGCKRRLSSGLDWVFEQVEEAIILEDDCLPHLSFFRFCEELLERYRHDPRVAQINGVNFQSGYRLNEDSYYFSVYNHIWGWASWRDRWQNNYDVGMKHWPLIRAEGRITDLVGSKAEADFWANIFELVHQGKIDTWDYQWTFACMRQSRLAVMPNVNLISNIGFGPSATHTTGSSAMSNLTVEAMRFPLRIPEGLVVSRKLDKRFFNRLLATPSRLRIVNKFKRTLNKLYGSNNF